PPMRASGGGHASRGCSGVNSGLPAPRARFCASVTASCAFTVSLLKFIELPHIESKRLILQKTPNAPARFQACKSRALLSARAREPLFSDAPPLPHQPEESREQNGERGENSEAQREHESF